MGDVFLTTLSSGLPCAIYATSSPVCYCALSTLAGTRYEPDGLAGLAHFSEHMLFKGTEKRKSTTSTTGWNDWEGNQCVYDKRRMYCTPPC